MTEDPPFAPLACRWERYAQLSPEDRQAILSLPHVRRSLDREAYVVRDGDKPDHCCLLLSGFAYRHKLVSDGARQIISIHIKGEFVDLQNCLLGIADHNVQTLTRAEVALVPKKAIRELASDYPTVGRAMWIDTLIDSSIFREWVVNVGRRDSVTRIAHLLCELALRMEAAGLAEDHNYELPMTQEKLADAVGLTSVHVNRVLKTLRQNGLISLNSRSLTILDWERLREVGDFNERYLHHQV